MLWEYSPFSGCKITIYLGNKQVFERIFIQLCPNYVSRPFFFAINCAPKPLYIQKEQLTNMLKIVIIMLCGIGAGYLLRKRSLKIVPSLITILIWVLLFLLGTEVGGDKRLIHSLSTLGLEALVLSVGGVCGSVLLTWILWKNIKHETESHDR